MTDPADGPAAVAAAKLAEVHALAAAANQRWRDGDRPGALEALHGLMPAAAVAAGALTVLVRPSGPDEPDEPDDPPSGYELVFTGDGRQDVVRVSPTGTLGPGGHPVYADPTGAVRAEISTGREVRMLATTGHQEPQSPTGVRPLTR